MNDFNNGLITYRVRRKEIGKFFEVKVRETLTSHFTNEINKGRAIPPGPVHQLLSRRFGLTKLESKFILRLYFSRNRIGYVLQDVDSRGELI